MDPRLQSQVVRTVQPQILQLCLREGGRKGKEGEGGKGGKEGRGEKRRRGKEERKRKEGEYCKLKAPRST